MLWKRGGCWLTSRGWAGLFGRRCWLAATCQTLALGFAAYGAADRLPLPPGTKLLSSPGLQQPLGKWGLIFRVWWRLGIGSLLAACLTIGMIPCTHGQSLHSLFCEASGRMQSGMECKGMHKWRQRALPMWSDPNRLEEYSAGSSIVVLVRAISGRLPPNLEISCSESRKLVSSSPVSTVGPCQGSLSVAGGGGVVPGKLLRSCSQVEMPCFTSKVATCL